MEISKRNRKLTQNTEDSTKKRNDKNVHIVTGLQTLWPKALLCNVPENMRNISIPETKAKTINQIKVPEWNSPLRKGPRLEIKFLTKTNSKISCDLWIFRQRTISHNFTGKNMNPTDKGTGLFPLIRRDFGELQWIWHEKKFFEIKEKHKTFLKAT